MGLIFSLQICFPISRSTQKNLLSFFSSVTIFFSPKKVSDFPTMQTPYNSLIFFTLFSLILSNLNSLSHSFSLSPENNNITLFGEAFFTTNNSVALTQELSACHSSSSSSSSSFMPLSPFYNNGVGRALYARRIQFLDPSTNTTSSFSCSFSFSIVPSPLCSSGDGIAFLIAPETSADATDDPFSASKGHMGLPRPALALQDSFFAVEFDTSFDPLLGDINGNHVGIDLNDAVSVVSVDLIPRGIDLTSGREITAWIEYRNSMNMVRVWLGYSPATRPPNPVLVAQIDLSELFNKFMYVGFSSSNGHGSSLHVVNKWKFKTFQFHFSEVLPIDNFEEGDCFICSDISENSISSSTVETSDIENVKNGLSSRKMKFLREMVLGLGGLIAFFFSVLAIIGIISFVVIRKRRRVAKRRMESLTSRLQSRRIPTRLSLAEIRAATLGFDRSLIVGEGASATVYKGSLAFGGEVAVKRFQRGNNNGASSSSSNHPYTNEFATMISCLRHKNLIQLQGWCSEGSELVLVYEYMPNGSLDKILHKQTESAITLSWVQRLNIVLGVASALGYLHDDCERQIIHRDVKTCNIMLAADFTAKLGDFGLAEVYEHSSTVASRDAASPAGTMGYLAPEYVYSGVATVKSDVYSFGVVVLEVATGRRPVDEGGMVLVDWAWGLWEKGRLAEAAEPRLRGRATEKEVERMLIVGLACVHPNHVKRPTAKEAARILRREVPLPALPARKPRLRLRTVLPDEFEEVLNFGADERKSLDDDPFVTPRSDFS